jgi:hypothetical protein
MQVKKVYCIIQAWWYTPTIPYTQAVKAEG